MKILLTYSVRILLGVLIFSAGANVNAQESSTANSSREYNVDSFGKIDIGGAFDIVLIKGDAPKVKITAEEKMFEKINVEVNDGVLKISFKSKRIKSSPNIKVHITFSELNSLILSGASKLSSASPIDLSKLEVKSSGASEIDLELNTEELEVDVSGAGKVKLAGVAKNLIAEVSGAGELKAKQLTTENTDVSVSGAGNANVYASNEFTCHVSGAGNVNYTGDPKTKSINKSGSGTISPETIEGKRVVIVDVNEDPENVNVKVAGLDIKVVEEGDTTKVTVGNHNLIIDDDGNVKYSKCKKNKFNGHWAGVDLGVNGYINESGNLDLPQEYEFLELNQAKSWTFAINPFEQNFNLIRNHFGLITGIGIQWMNYRFNNNVVLSGDSSTIYGFKDESRNYSKSKLNICFLNVPVLLEYQTNKHMKSNSFHITAGMIFGLRIGSHSKTVYDDNKKQKIKSRDDFHLHPFKMDATARIGWGWINLFGTYSITTLFKNDKGPELYPFTAGITLVGW